MCKREQRQTAGDPGVIKKPQHPAIRLGYCGPIQASPGEARDARFCPRAGDLLLGKRQFDDITVTDLQGNRTGIALLFISLHLHDVHQHAFDLRQVE